MKQLIKVRLSFMERPKTMLMVSHDTGVERANICRYVDVMRKSGQIETVRRGLCEITGCSAMFFTTNIGEGGK